jgi:hypothetical protein
MKKICLTILILMMLAASACSTTSNTSQTGSSVATGDLPIATQLVAGTIKLEGSDQQVSAEQAKALLPLWQVYSELITSDTAAQEEIECLLDQVQESMTSKQRQAITDMQLTSQEIFALMQQQGTTMSQTGQAGSTNQSSGSSGPADGGMPMGAPLDGGGGMPMDVMPAGSQSQASSQSGATTATQAQSVILNQALIETLIEILQTKAAA